MISTVSQAKYLAHRLTKESKFGEIEKLIPVYLKSGIEVYPHQIAAAYFAVSNPFSKGFILCDEVGLGKAIEAMLVIAQYYYSGRNKIAVIVPPLLIPQWQRLISDKFDLSCKIVEKGIEIDDNDEIILISYTQAAEEWESLSKIKWNLAVFEEAHRLRKYYTGENRTATNLHNAFEGVQKLLLTATPMQVNVMDLYGLVNFIDDTVFTDERAFYKRYYKKPENYKELRERLMPFTFRTLRNQVRGDVKLPDRIIHTQEYALNENEKKLLELLSKYVDKPKKLAFPDMDTYELGLMLFKLFSSSIYALSKTLSGVFFRLNQMGNAEALEEAKEIKVMLDLATSIVDTSKWATFLRGLEQGFSAMKEKGQPQKVVVFTENRQTQEYIFKQLGKYTKYKTTLFEDEGSIEAWQKRGNILIATDSACESFNMQFCSFIINYELPWNVQKIEQRIGRCQRIGQDNDVYVLNFLNRENYADVRFYELVFKRTTMFDGILGASDGVISDVVSGKIEETMAKGFAAVRSKEEIEKEFDDIRAEYDKEVKERKKQSDELLFNTFDGKIVEKTKNYANLLKAECAKFKADLWDFCEYAFKRYGSIDSEKKTIFLSRSVFKSGNIPEMKLYFEGDHPRSSMITVTNRTVKEVLSKYTIQDTVQETIEFDGGNKTYPSCGQMALFTITFFDKTSAFSKNVLIGTDADGAPIEESVLREILSLPVSLCSEASAADFEGLKKLYEERKPQIVQKAREEQNDTLNFEIGRIRQRAEDKKREFAAEIEILTREIDSMKRKGTTKHEQAFVNNQSAADLKARLMKLKHDEFMAKMTLNKQVQEKIAELEKSVAVSIYERTSFMIQFEVR